jgi:hydroxymethylglutaryl-CoA synthase
MHFFEKHGNRDLEGATTMNACYGGTAALFNSVAWVESSEWDGRYALAVAADIAVYEEGAARPTGGAGAVAVLVGPGAPLRLTPQTRATHAADVWDFYKPEMSSEYPTVDGKLSQSCYIRAVDDCYSRHMAKVQRQRQRDGTVADSSDLLTLSEAYDFSIFHSPYNKLVQQSFARLFVGDARRLVAAGQALPEHLSPLAPWADAEYEGTIMDRDLMKASTQVADAFYASMVAPSDKLSKNIGNTYTAAVFANLLCLVANKGGQLTNKNTAVFSYGSGAIASMYGINGVDTTAADYLDTLHMASCVTGPSLAQLNGYDHALGARGDKTFTLQGMAETIGLDSRLDARTAVSPEEYTAALDARKAFYGQKSATPSSSADELPAGTWYLKQVNDDYTRVYDRA